MIDDKQRWDNYRSEIICVGNSIYKKVRSDGYNYNFTIRSQNNPGKMTRWGYIFKDNPPMAPSPEILDIEVSTGCTRGCSWCYKSNIPEGKTMDPEVLKRILRITKNNLTQVALGIGDVESIGTDRLQTYFIECRRLNIIPNITINGSEMDEDYYKLFAMYCGTVDVSVYDENAYNVIKKLTKYYKVQCNIHTLLAEETVLSNLKLISDIKHNKKLSNIHALLFLMLKKKGNRNYYNTISKKNFNRVLDFAIAENVQIGMDSCSATTFITYLNEHYSENTVNKVIPMIEPCESGLFSLYINVDGKVFPCSFMEGQPGWTEGLSIPSTEDDFTTEVWFSQKMINWRKRLLNTNDINCRECPEFNIGKLE